MFLYDEIKAKYESKDMVFDGTIVWEFDNSFDRNTIIFGLDNSNSRHVENQINGSTL